MSSGTKMLLKTPTMNSSVAFNHSLWVGTRWWNTPCKPWSRPRASLSSSWQSERERLILEDTSPLAVSACQQQKPCWGRRKVNCFIPGHSLLRLVLLLPLWTHPNSKGILSTLQCFFPYAKAFENRRKKVVVRWMKNLVADCFILAKSLKRLGDYVTAHAFSRDRRVIPL